MRFIGGFRVELAQPSLGVICPVVEVIDGALRKYRFAECCAQVKKIVVQSCAQLRLGQCTPVILSECAMQETDDEWSIISEQQSPCGMALTQSEERVIIHVPPYC